MLSAKLKVEADNANRDFDYFRYHKNKSTNCFIILSFEESNDKRTIAQNTVWWRSWKWCIAHATYRLVTNRPADNWLILSRLYWFPKLTVGHRINGLLLIQSGILFKPAGYFSYYWNPCLDIELYSTLSLFTQVYKWVPATYYWGVALWWTSILSRGE